MGRWGEINAFPKLNGNNTNLVFLSSRRTVDSILHLTKEKSLL